MDPNTTLTELREAVIQLGRLNTPDAPDDVYVATNAVLERWEALDTWISNGGFFPTPWLEAQRTALENVRPAAPVPPAHRTRCEQNTLAGTTVPVPCPPTFRDPLDASPRVEDEAAAELERRGAYDDPDVLEAIHEHLHTNPWRGPRWAGSLTAAEVLNRKLAGDD